jgi:hypothetical protein
VTNHNDCASVSHTKIPSIKANTIDSSTKEEEQDKEDEKEEEKRLSSACSLRNRKACVAT